jgi:hypothetical protein
VRVRNAVGNNVNNAVVVVRWTVIEPSGGESGTTECRTDSDGRCRARAPSGNNNNLPSNTERVRLEIVTINGQAAPAGTEVREVDDP